MRVSRDRVERRWVRTEESARRGGPLLDSYCRSRVVVGVDVNPSLRAADAEAGDDFVRDATPAAVVELGGTSSLYRQVPPL